MGPEAVAAIILGALLQWLLIRWAVHSALTLWSERILGPLAAEHAKAITEALRHPR